MKKTNVTNARIKKSKKIALISVKKYNNATTEQ